MTLILSALWLGLVCWALGTTRGQICGGNVVQMYTRPSQQCTLDNRLGAINANSARTTQAVQRGRLAAVTCYRNGVVVENANVAAGSVQQRTPQYHHYLATVADPGDVSYRNNTLYEYCLAREIGSAVADEYGLPRSLSGQVLVRLNISTIPALCVPAPVCNATARYRTYDGSCNNLRNPTWAQANRPYTRLHFQVYDDGIYSKRRARNGRPLPNPRAISRYFFPDRNYPDWVNMLIAMQWGQVIAHDTTLSTDQTNRAGFGMRCCTQDNKPLNASQLGIACIPIAIPPDDPMATKYGKTCMSLARNNVTFNHNCRLGAAENTNAASQIIDASLVYGTSEATSASLRTFSGGRLITSTDRYNRTMLPQSRNATEDCDLTQTNDTCYLAGDPRVNQNPQLATLQIILLRFHNDMADELSRLNPRWSDDDNFQETRRILIAAQQHITYNELLPIYLGDEAMWDYDLYPLDNDYSYNYNPFLNPTTFNTFAGAGYRYFHTLTEGRIKMMDEARCPFRNIDLGDYFTRIGIVATPEINFDGLLRSLVSQPTQRADRFFTNQTSERMFSTTQEIGEDLEALDVERGRDRGEASYNDFRELCGLRRAMSFQDFQDTIPNESVQALKYAYSDPNDVDLFVGLTLEVLYPGSIVGPTLRCILIEQFSRFKHGDRFWFENGDMAHSFTPAQLNEIRSISLARLFCNYGDNITHMQPHAFHAISNMNPLLPCDSLEIPELDLSAWEE